MTSSLLKFLLIHVSSENITLLYILSYPNGQIFDWLSRTNKDENTRLITQSLIPYACTLHVLSHTYTNTHTRASNVACKYVKSNKLYLSTHPQTALAKTLQQSIQHKIKQNSCTILQSNKIINLKLKTYNLFPFLFLQFTR